MLSQECCSLMITCGLWAVGGGCYTWSKLKLRFQKHVLNISPHFPMEPNFNLASRLHRAWPLPQPLQAMACFLQLAKELAQERARAWELVQLVRWHQKHPPKSWDEQQMPLKIQSLVPVPLHAQHQILNRIHRMKSKIHAQAPERV